jgi:AcrR family transcriptional regulator
MSQERKPDRRIERTCSLLHQALGSLIREKPYDDISIKEILERANVSRSTFYMHFEDKDALLAAAIRSLLGAAQHESPEGAPGNDRLTSFGLPILEHIHQHGNAHGADGRGIHRHPEAQSRLHERLKGEIVLWFKEQAAGAPRQQRTDTRVIPGDLLIQYLASSFVLVLEWWLRSKSPCSPAQANELFRKLVRPVVEEACPDAGRAAARAHLSSQTPGSSLRSRR